MKMKLDIQLFGTSDGKVSIDTELNTKNFENGLDRMQNSTQKAGSTMKSIVASLGIAKLISQGINLITSSVDDAVKRVDALNNFPKVMSNLGIASKDAEKSIKKMSDKLAGLPTTLDQGALAVQRFTSANGDVKKSTDLFLALNNAILAGGAGAEIQSSALEQLSQAYAKGKPDMMEWRTAMTAMPAQLKQVAKAMGYVSADQLGEALREGTVSMDDFMNAIIKLNEEGIDGFQNFEEQARNSTGGIGTAITVAKTQVVKGVADMIGSLNKALKKSNMPELSQLIADMGKEAKKQLDKLGTLLSKVNFKKLLDNIKKLVPIVGTLTAGFVAYNGVLKVMKIQKAIGNFAQLTKTFLTLIPAMKGANLATVALNSSFAVSPIGLLIAGVAGLTAGLYLLNKASEQNVTSTQKINNTLKEYDKSMQEADKSRQKYLDKHMNELENTESLYRELQSLVDVNGKVKEGYEDRVNFVIGELNNALGTEIKMTDGVIENYQGMKEAVEDIIKSKRAKILLDAQESAYNKAKDEATKLEKNYANAYKEYNKELDNRKQKLQEIKKEYGLTNKQLSEVSKTLTYTDKNGQKVSLAFEKLGQDLTIVNSRINVNKNTLNDASKTYAENQKIIGDYENAILQMSNSNYDAVLKMYEDTTNYQSKTAEETKANYDSAIASQKSYLQYLKDNKSSYDEDVYNKEVEATKKRIQVLEDEQRQMDVTVSSGQAKVKGTWNKALSDQLSEITGKNIAFKQTANGNIQAYINGHKEGAPMTKKQAKKMAEDMVEEMKKAKTGSKQAGIDFTTGTTQGIQSGQGGTFSAVRNYGSSILQAFKNSLKEHSPSKATKEMGINFDKGFEQGIDDGKSDSLKTVQSYGQDMLDELSGIYKNVQSTISFEQGRIQSNVETGRVFNTLQNSTPVAINVNAEVEMDSQKVGRLVTPEVSKTIKSGGGV